MDEKPRHPALVRLTATVGLHYASSERLNVRVSLSAETVDDRKISTGRTDFGLSGPRHGIWHRWHGPPLPDDRNEADRIALQDHRVDTHDVTDGINQMLGRDPDLHRPPRLAWDNLITALREAGITVDEAELIEVPLTVELTPELRAELDRK